jgi:predicted Zn-dependent protease
LYFRMPKPPAATPDTVKTRDTPVTPAVIEVMRRIDRLLQAGQIREAHDRLAEVVVANPRYVEALRLLAGTKQALGDTSGAEESLRRALVLDPGRVAVLVMLGELLLLTGRAAEAEPLLERALGGGAVPPRAAFLLARHYNDTGRPGRAVAAAAPLASSGRADADLVTQHVTALAALGQTAEAVTDYRRLVAQFPGSAEVAHGLAMALNLSHQPGEAERLAGDMLARGHKSAALYRSYAGSLAARGAFESAEAALRDSLALEPRSLDAHNNLAKLVWMRTGHAGDATAALDRALERFAADDALWAAKAAILQGAGDARGAYACLRERAALAGAQPMLLVRTGLAALEFDPAAALQLATRALAIVPTNAAACALAVAAHLGVGDAHAALAHCDALRAEAPDDQYLIALQTTAWRMLGDPRYAELCDYEALVLPQQLDVPPGWTNLGAFLAELSTGLSRLHDPQSHALLFQSLRNGTETMQDLSKNPDPVIQALFAAFAAPIREYLSRLGPGSDPLRGRNRGGWRFNGSWSVRLRTAGHHTNHVHPRGWISSACYIDLPDSMRGADRADGCLTFGEPGILTTPSLASDYCVRPQVGMLVLFPSYVWHGTVPFHGDQPRLTVAFDVVPDR